MKLGVEVQGVDRLKRKVKNAESEVIAPPWKEAMEAIGVVGQNLAIRNAPIGSPNSSRDYRPGQTVARMYHRVQQKPLPLWVRVGSHAKRVSKSYPQGYGYPRRLNFDPRSRYKGWFDKAMDQTKGAMSKLLDIAAKKMEGRWKQ